MPSERESLLLEAVLDALAVPKAYDREVRIAKSHAGSYGWVWEPEGSFYRFLSDSESRIFWFSGLPGTGKSTLLRHIKQCAELRPVLEQWSADRELDIASFFFWESGLVSQRSFEGALRSILHQILSQHPYFVPLAFAELWTFLQTASTAERVRRLSSWQLIELRAAIIDLFASIESEGQRKVFLFFDGIDEFEGDPEDIVQLLRVIAVHRCVKICVSSRPWPIFERAFSDQPHLRLQDATWKDMEDYVSQSLSDVGSNLPEVVRTIVTRAEGVFLWATIAVNEINRWDIHLRNDPESISGLPTGLDNLYDHILNGVASDPERRHTANVLRLVTAREDVCASTRNDDSALLTAWDLVLSMRYEDRAALSSGLILVDQQRALRWAQKQIASTERCSRQLMRFSIDLDTPQRSTVSFYHRTVRTWARSEKAAGLLRWYEGEPHSTLLRTILLSWKVTSSQKSRRTRNVLGWWSQIMTAFTHARLAPDSHQDRIFDLMLELDRSLDSLYLARQQPMSAHPLKSLDSWARSCFGTLESRGQMPYEDPFLALAVRFGLTHFVKRYLAAGHYVEGEGYPILSWSTVYLFSRQASIYPLTEPKMVTALLVYGLDPNKRVTAPKKWDEDEDRPPKIVPSPWETTVEVCQQAIRRGWVNGSQDDSARWGSAIESFRKHGVDEKIMVKATHKDHSERADMIVERLQVIARSRV